MAAGFPDVRIIVSGGLDEHDVAALLAAGAPIDGFGIGTKLDVSADAPSLEMVYKLVRFGGRDMLKVSPGKGPGWGEAGRPPARPGRAVGGDTLGLAEDVPPGAAAARAGDAGGRLIGPHPALAELRAHCARQIAALPTGVRRLRRRRAIRWRRAMRCRVRQSGGEGGRVDGVSAGDA